METERHESLPTPTGLRSGVFVAQDLGSAPKRWFQLSTNQVATARRQAREIVLAQLGLTLLLAAVGAVFFGRSAGLSALAGGGIGVLATAYMAFALLKHGDGTDAGRIARSFFLGWAIKVLMTVALLVIAFRAESLSPVPLLVAYVATFFAYWVGAANKRP